MIIYEDLRNKKPTLSSGWSSFFTMPSEPTPLYRVRRICQNHNLNGSARAFDINIIVYPNHVYKASNTRFSV